ncbi:hypothetical protein O0B28_11115, partial [Staphylococcus pseudintermedius]|nr:hypothetical protein [Staphylococcus pseudintermedius]
NDINIIARRAEPYGCQLFLALSLTFDFKATRWRQMFKRRRTKRCPLFEMANEEECLLKSSSI